MFNIIVLTVFQLNKYEIYVNYLYFRYKDHQNVNTLPGFGAVPGSKPRISISDRDGSLIITVVEKEDMGWYTCRPSNGVGQDPEAGAYLNITCKWKLGQFQTVC